MLPSVSAEQRTWEADGPVKNAATRSIYRRRSWAPATCWSGGVFSSPDHTVGGKNCKYSHPASTQLIFQLSVFHIRVVNLVLVRRITWASSFSSITVKCSQPASVPREWLVNPQSSSVETSGHLVGTQMAQTDNTDPGSCWTCCCTALIKAFLIKHGRTRCDVTKAGLQIQFLHQNGRKRIYSRFKRFSVHVQLLSSIFGWRWPPLQIQTARRKLRKRNKTSLDCSMSIFNCNIIELI